MFEAVMQQHRSLFLFALWLYGRQYLSTTLVRIEMSQQQLDGVA